MDEDLQAQVDIARRPRTSRHSDDAGGVPTRSSEDELVDRDLAYVTARPEHRGCTDTIERLRRL